MEIEKEGKFLELLGHKSTPLAVFRDVDSDGKGNIPGKIPKVWGRATA